MSRESPNSRVLAFIEEGRDRPGEVEVDDVRLELDKDSAEGGGVGEGESGAALAGRVTFEDDGWFSPLLVRVGGGEGAGREGRGRGRRKKGKFLLRRSIVNRGKCLIIHHVVQRIHRKFLIIFAIFRPKNHIYIYICAVTVRPVQTIQAIVYRYRRRIDRVMTP